MGNENSLNKKAHEHTSKNTIRSGELKFDTDNLSKRKENVAPSTQISIANSDSKEEVINKKINTIGFNLKRIKEYIDILDNESPEYKINRMLFTKKALSELFPLIRNLELANIDQETNEKICIKFDAIVKHILTYNREKYEKELKQFTDLVVDKCT